LRVLHVISDDGTGQQLRLLVRRLPLHSEVVTLSPPGPVTVAMRAEGTVVHEVTAGDDRDLAAVLRLRGLVRRGRFDVVHTHLFRAGVHGRLAAWLAGVPRVVATEYHLDADRRMAAGVRTLYRTGERHGRLTIAVSAAVADRLRAWRVPDERITVIPKAVDAAEFGFDPALRAVVRARLHIAPGTPVIGAVGRLEPRRRFDDLIRSLREVPGAVALLVGDGPAREALERLATIEGVADRVRFAGAVGHPRAMLCAMDVLASPARDTFGLVVLEAMAAGLPALYGSCEPLAGGPAVTGHTRRLTAHDPESLPRALRAEVLCHAERRGTRLPAAQAGDRYRADSLASAVARVYDQLF
jgi:glycosyltransferase involved in cell wall biosynthesis